jgi:hypothetical protein
VRHDGETHAATDVTIIHQDDRLVAVGTRGGLDQFERVVGRDTDEDLTLTGTERHVSPGGGDRSRRFSARRWTN